MAKCYLGELRPIDRAIAIQNTRSEVLDDLLVYGLSRLHQLMGDVIRLNELHPQRGEHLADDRFSARNAACEADFQLAFPRNTAEAKVISPQSHRDTEDLGLQSLSSATQRRMKSW